MKRGIFIIGLFLFLFIMSKAQQWEWAKKHDFEFTETQSTIGGADSEGNLYLTLMNISDVKNQPGAAYRLLKLDPNGQIIWSKDISQYSQGRITTGPNGNSYIAYAGKLGCFDKEGNETWKVNDFNVKSFGKLKIRNGVLIVDGSEYAGIDSITLFTAAYSLQGGLISKTYLNLNKFAKTAWDQQLHVWAIHGWYPDPVTSNTGKLLKFDSTGSMLFSREIPYPDGILIDSEGNAYVNGGFRAPIELGGKKYAVPADLIASYQFIAKYSVTGQLLWYKIIEGSLGANRMSCDKEGIFIMWWTFRHTLKLRTLRSAMLPGACW